MNAIVKKFENDSMKGRDSTGLWKPIPSLEGGTDTLGYGHKLTHAEQTEGYIKLGDERIAWKDGLTDAQIDMLLDQDMKIANGFVDKEFPTLGPAQKDAVASLVFNVGAAKFKSSKAYEDLKKGDYEGFSKNAFDPKKGFTRINGEVSNGLIRRRQKEAEMFGGA